MADLITLTDAQASLTGLTVAQIASLPGAISAASRACESYCARSLALASFDEEYTPGTTRIIRLKNYPVASIARVATDLSTALSIQAAPGAWRATVAMVNDQGLILIQVGGSHEGMVLLAFAAYATTTALEAAVNATPGWTATVNPGMGPCPTAEYRPIQGALGALQQPANLSAYATDLGDWDLEEKTGKLELRQIRIDPYSYPARTYGGNLKAAKVRVLYTAGFSPVPDDAAEACRITVRAMLERRDNVGILKSESLGNTSYMLADWDTSLPPAAMQLLGRYRSRRLA
jgi:hypothetical protein